MRLQDKVAIVTGAASGIGRSTAMLFAREGARLVLNDIDTRGLEALMVQMPGERARTVAGNVADEAVARRLAQESISAFGRIDILVNNAGVHFVKDITR
jgi:meso-butanediol dehydrogenase/(S,S)-butanediol dehydrogenase/diacetyl reductase